MTGALSVKSSGIKYLYVLAVEIGKEFNKK